MALIDRVMVFDDVNTSVQVGDTLYYTYAGGDYSTVTTVGQQGSITNTYKFGLVIGVTSNTVTVRYDDHIVSPPPDTAFISFAKDKKVNTTSLLGHYMEVKFVNDSSGKVELFSIGSEVSESSK